MDDTPARNTTSTASPAALAANWRTVIFLDLLLGTATVAVGVVLAIGSNRGAGIVLALLGTTYSTMVALRARRWARTRRQAQLGD